MFDVHSEWCLTKESEEMNRHNDTAPTQQQGYKTAGYFAFADENSERQSQMNTMRSASRYVLVTDLVPSEIACFASSPGRMRRTEVWISREEMVDFLEYDASSVEGVSLCEA
jgi:hypothetical protein